jgi:hypothetical protein
MVMVNRRSPFSDSFCDFIGLSSVAYLEETSKRNKRISIRASRSRNTICSPSFSEIQIYPKEVIKVVMGEVVNRLKIKISVRRLLNCVRQLASNASELLVVG